MSRQIGDLLPNVTIDTIDDDDMVLDAVILIRVVSTSGDGKPRLTIATTPDLDWMLQIGMVRAALGVVTDDLATTQENEDE